MENELTSYGEKLNRKLPLAEYPRPQMVRESYLCLNGPWQYAITRQGSPPLAWDGEILVPFSPESVLSGVGRTVLPGDFLWYRRTFSLPAGFMKDRLLLHFGAVDQTCTVYVNGREAGRHEGGFLPFSFEITGLLAGGEQELMLAAADPSETAAYARGRQSLTPGGPWHAAQSGIWQTVWLESVPAAYITGLRITPQYDENAVDVLVSAAGGALRGMAQIYARSTLVTAAPFESGRVLRMALPGALSWHPAMPFLYTLKIIGEGDAVDSYFGMRKIEVRPNAQGQGQIFLNNKPFAGVGLLDQGWYSDGLLTPPSDRAMTDGLRYAHECGFNMIRKHGKFEPLRWYHHCDKSGFLVWQDLPAGGHEAKPTLRERLFSQRANRSDALYAPFGREDKAARLAFEGDMARAALLLHSTPCLGVWVLFQRGQGQFNAQRLAAAMKGLDPARLVDHASGWYDQRAGDILGLHLFADKKKPPALPEAPDGRAVCVAQADAYGFAEAGHFSGGTPFAGVLCPSREEFAAAVASLYRTRLPALAARGVSAFILCQLADAQDEVSGLLSGDRRVKKIPARALAALNEQLLAAIRAENC